MDQREILEVKNKITELKNSLEKFYSLFKKAEERNNKFEDK